MKQLLLGLLIGSAVVTGAQETRPTPPTNVPTGARYQVFFGPWARADAFLVDTTNGRVWRPTKFTGLEGDPDAWMYMTRIDNSADFDKWILTQVPRKP